MHTVCKSTCELFLEVDLHDGVVGFRIVVVREVDACGFKGGFHALAHAEQFHIVAGYYIRKVIGDKFHGVDAAGTGYIHGAAAYFAGLCCDAFAENEVVAGKAVAPQSPPGFRY